MLIEQIIEFKLRGPAPQVVYVLLQLVIFMTTQKSLRKIFEWIKYLQLKYCTWQCTLVFSTGVKSLKKFNPEMQDFKRNWT